MTGAVVVVVVRRSARSAIDHPLEKPQVLHLWAVRWVRGGRHRREACRRSNKQCPSGWLAGLPELHSLAFSFHVRIVSLGSHDIQSTKKDHYRHYNRRKDTHWQAGKGNRWDTYVMLYVGKPTRAAQAHQSTHRYLQADTLTVTDNRTFAVDDN